jgi:hypothetical protein
MQTIKILFSVGAGNLPRVAGAPTSAGCNLCAVVSVSEEADLATVFLALVSRILTEDPPFRFMISSPMVFPKILSQT